MITSAGNQIIVKVTRVSLTLIANDRASSIEIFITSRIGKTTSLFKDWSGTRTFNAIRSGKWTIHLAITSAIKFPHFQVPKKVPSLPRDYSRVH